MDRQTSPPMLDDFASVRNDINEVWDSVKEIDEKTFEVESPWPAAILCMDLVASLASGEPLDETRQDITDLSQLKSLPAILPPVLCTNKQMMTAFQKWLEIQEKWAREEAKREDAARGWGDLAKLLKELLSMCK